MADPVRSDPPAHRSLPERLLGVFALDGGAFDDIENDASALLPATAVVVLAGLARGVGAEGPSRAAEIVGSGLTGVAVWLVAGLIIWGIGVQRMGYTSNYPELLRTLGFAAAPLLLLVLRVLPLGAAATPVWLVAHGWALLALVVASREALDTSTRNAVVVCLLSIATAVAVVAGMSAVLLVARPAN